MQFASIEARAINTDIIDEFYSNRAAVAFQLFVGAIHYVLAIAIFSMNDTRKSNFEIIFCINFFDHTYKLCNFFNVLRSSP